MNENDFITRIEELSKKFKTELIPVSDKYRDLVIYSNGTVYIITACKDEDGTLSFILKLDGLKLDIFFDKFYVDDFGNFVSVSAFVGNSYVFGIRLH